jgi:predicted nucleic acid-binding protein
VILVDSGPLVAGSDTDDRHYRMRKELLGSAAEDLLVPATVSAEVCYLLESEPAANLPSIRPRPSGGVADSAVFDAAKPVHSTST